MKKLKSNLKKTAVITGASEGIGAALVKELLKNNPVFLQYKNKQFSNYSLYYFFDKSKESDSLHHIISYQLRGEQNGVISNFKNFKIKRLIDTISDTTKTDSSNNMTRNEEEIIKEIIEKTQKSLEDNSSREITYYILKGESFMLYYYYL